MIVVVRATRTRFGGGGGGGVRTETVFSCGAKVSRRNEFNYVYSRAHVCVRLRRRVVEMENDISNASVIYKRQRLIRRTTTCGSAAYTIRILSISIFLSVSLFRSLLVSVSVSLLYLSMSFSFSRIECAYRINALVSRRPGIFVEIPRHTL